MSEPNFEKVAIDNIEATAATQVRVRLDRGMIDQYTEDFENGANFPPLDAYREKNSERIILADGFHRHRAAINAGRTEIGVYIHEGGMKEALIHALGSNAEHGFRRTKADKRHAVEMALKDPEISQLKQTEIADICRVHRNTVRKIQNELLSDDTSNGDNAHNVQKKKPTPPGEDDVLDSGEVSQEQVDLDELRQALALIKAFPYDGEMAAQEKLPLEVDDVADAEYVSTWLAALVIAVRNGEEESEDGEAKDPAELE